MTNSTPTLLIVDDSPILRMYIRRAALQIGIHAEDLHEAGDGEDALSVIRSQAIDLILLDVHMPVMDGEAFLKEAQDSDLLGETIVVIVSTEGNADRLQTLRELGAQQCIHKPFEPEVLREIVSEIVGGKA